MAAPLLLRHGGGRRRAPAADAGNGDGDHLGGLKELVTDLGDIDAREVTSFPLGDGIVLRVGRYGPYVERGDDRDRAPASAPTCPRTCRRTS